MITTYTDWKTHTVLQVFPCWNFYLLINGVSLSETELGNGKTNHIMLVHFHTPMGQDIEHRHGPRDAGAAVGPHAIADFLAMQDRSEH
jgi:hypothetical protein